MASLTMATRIRRDWTIQRLRKPSKYFEESCKMLRVLGTQNKLVQTILAFGYVDRFYAGQTEKALKVHLKCGTLVVQRPWRKVKATSEGCNLLFAWKITKGLRVSWTSEDLSEPDDESVELFETSVNLEMSTIFSFPLFQADKQCIRAACLYWLSWGRYQCTKVGPIQPENTSKMSALSL
jgi:hypothetical protein